MKNWELKTKVLMVIALLAVSLSGWLFFEVDLSRRQMKRINRVSSILLNSYIIKESPRAMERGITEIYLLSGGENREEKSKI